MEWLNPTKLHRPDVEERLGSGGPRKLQHARRGHRSRQSVRIDSVPYRSLGWLSHAFVKGLVSRGGPSRVRERATIENLTSLEAAQLIEDDGESGDDEEFRVSRMMKKVMNNPPMPSQLATLPSSKKRYSF
jgi:hypothetical protein